MIGLIEIYAEECNGTAGFLINDKKNNNIILDLLPNTLSQGTHVIDLQFKENTTLEFKIYNKNHNIDTLVDKKGKVIKDKHIQVLGMRLHHIYLEEKDLYNSGFDPYFGFNNMCKEFFLPPKIQWPQWYLQLRKQ